MKKPLCLDALWCLITSALWIDSRNYCSAFYPVVSILWPNCCLEGKWLHVCCLDLGISSSMTLILKSLDISTASRIQSQLERRNLLYLSHFTFITTKLFLLLPAAFEHISVFPICTPPTGVDLLVGSLFSALPLGLCCNSYNFRHHGDGFSNREMINPWYYHKIDAFIKLPSSGFSPRLCSLLILFFLLALHVIVLYFPAKYKI